MAKIKTETLSKTNYKIMQKTFNDSPGRFSIMVPPTRYLRSHSQAILVLGKACFLSCLFPPCTVDDGDANLFAMAPLIKHPFLSLSLSLSFSPSFGGLQKPLFTPLPLWLLRCQRSSEASIECLDGGLGFSARIFSHPSMDACIFKFDHPFFNWS